MPRTKGKEREVQKRRYINRPEVLAERRRRLPDVSWWMRYTAGSIARRSNAEAPVTGHFWEGRYHSQIFLDESSLLVCAAHVGLNPIRAALAETPETSDYTRAKDRIDDLIERADRNRPSTHDWERIGLDTHGWCEECHRLREDPL